MTINYIPAVGEECLFILHDAQTPKWGNCRVLAMSDLGVCIETYGDEGMGPLPRWIDAEERGQNLEFRTLHLEADVWEHHSGKRYELLHLANWFTTKEGFEPTAVYRDVNEGIVYSRPYAKFSQKFKPVDKSQSTESLVEQGCDILDSENAPVEVNQ